MKSINGYVVILDDMSRCIDHAMKLGRDVVVLIIRWYCKKRP